MKYLIADDESASRSRLRRMLTGIDFLENLGEARDGVEALEKLSTLQPELLFLDIEMPGLNGFEVLRSLPDHVSLPLVIFITGYDQHALEAFEANALAYLLKPVDPDALLKAVERARRLHQYKPDEEKEKNSILTISRQQAVQLHQIVGHQIDRMVLLRPEEILWFEILDGIVHAFTRNQKYWVNYQLSELETALETKHFFRARREALVNLSQVKEIKPYFKRGLLLVMNNDKLSEVIISERRIPILRQRIPGI